ncbi:MAG: hypothetical protein OXG19_07335 [Chloroflexi bacterium]|nr:hypothetical protein [Chloroflexota bacterium]
MPHTWWGLGAWLGIVVIAAVAGWLVGAELIAHSARQSEPVLVRPATPSASGAAGSVIVPRSGLSPFGHAAGLPGRQVLIGRVTGSDRETLTLAWAGGRTRFRFAEGSSFLLRLAQEPEATIEPGAAIALLVSESAGGALIAQSGLLLPEESRPQVLPGEIIDVLELESLP